MNDRIPKMTYTVKEAAEALGISTNKMYQLTFIEDFPVFGVGKSKRIPIEQLNEWIKSKAENKSDLEAWR